jgi:uncharacterized protein YdhG (YjbR/CyaY superfamily)
MADANKTPANHAAHFAKAEPDVRARLEAIQAEVEALVPGAERHIGYGMPAFRKGKVFFYFAAFKKHIGVYPPVSGPAELVARLAPYRGPKGNLLFPHDQPLPLELIGEVAEALAAQYQR